LFSGKASMGTQEGPDELLVRLTWRSAVGTGWPAASWMVAMNVMFGVAIGPWRSAVALMKRASEASRSHQPVPGALTFTTMLEDSATVPVVEESGIRLEA
jgi:hypothetical protein